jgi:hypothetical protein
MTSNRFHRRLVLALLAAALCAAGAVPTASAAPKPAVGVGSVAADGARVTVTGKARLAGVRRADRRAARVVLSLTDARGAVERFAARPARNGRFTARRTTRLRGDLDLRARLRVRGRPRGAVLLRRAAVAVDPPGGAGGTGRRLVGTFRLDPGARRADGSHAGSWFQMLTNTGGPLANPNSASSDKSVTLLAPGSDGGLRTDGHQPAPSPAFSAEGDALASSIIQPTSFHGRSFSVVTAPTDAQTKTSVPVPEIRLEEDRLRGQITAWSAQWNHQWFNQGTPKPDGTTPGRTTELRGTFDAASRRYVLEWQSLIVGGPFNGFAGRWHLEGEFVPAEGESGGGLPIGARRERAP